MPAKPSVFEPFEIPPGNLMTMGTPEVVGIKNYVTKRDFRRVADREIRREGYAYFAPSAARPVNLQGTVASNQPITCVHMARRTNGQTAIIAATATDIYRYYSMEDPRYFENEGTDEEYFYRENPSGVPLPDQSAMTDQYGSQAHNYFKYGIGSDIGGDYSDWEKIGSGFSPNGNRWQVVDVNGWTIFNNAVDLPVSFRVEDQGVIPLYELRDGGIASVGRIAAYQGLLVCGDIKQIKDADMEGFMFPGLAYNPYDPNLARAMRGIYSPSIYGPYSGETDRYQFRVLWSMANLPTRFAGSVNGQIAAGSNVLTLQYPTLALTVGQTIIIVGAGLDGGNLTAKITHIEPGKTLSLNDHGWYYLLEPPDHQILHLNIPALTSVGTGALTYGANIAPTDAQNFATVSVKPGQTYLFKVPAGVACNLQNTGDDSTAYPRALFAPASYSATTTFVAASSSVNISPTGQGVTLQLVTGQTYAAAQLADAIGSIGGLFEDLEDDGSAIVGMASLRSNLIVYKETSIFLGTFTGQSNSPFSFQQVYEGEEGLHFPNSLITVLGGANRYEGSGGQHYHFFAGHHGFYRFDEITLAPTPVFLEVQNTLFAHAFDDVDAVFSVENDLTNEIFMCQPGMWNGQGGFILLSLDPTICFDTKYSTVSTSSAYYTSGAMIKNPADGHLWFIMGKPDGTVVQYGLQETQPLSWGLGKGMFNRLGEGYASILQSGWGALSTKLNDCQINAYLVRLNAWTDLHKSLKVAVKTMTAGVQATLFDGYFGSPNAKEIYVPCTGAGTVFCDTITITEPDDYCEVSSRAVNARELVTHGAGRA